MIIVDPDQVSRAQERGQLLRKPAVDVEIGGAFAPVEVGQVQAVMEQRPEGAIGVAVVIAGMILGRKIERCVGDPRLLYDRGRRALYAGAGPSAPPEPEPARCAQGRKSTRLNSSHVEISYAVFCLKKKKKKRKITSAQ